ncbi:F0F1 ATP synthase subunit delta [Buchananella hordeovulneris]|uniref:F0F1 ATP synthase subunit delta n=1 Tax=Buchananella hordeovulneris TaxID=52770 RepID=UPI000F5E56F9|nr:F0F1 ATP synthase subunit delta [Buchananella hordeovulneris]RRD53072.1 F0F1 ATP synthase subunit delta [Buchananella hordeovulneris]
MRPTSAAALAATTGQWTSLLASGPRRGLPPARELFAVADLLTGHPRLASALTDTGRSATDRAELLRDLLAARVAAAELSPEVLDLLTGLVRHRWAEPADLAAACETLGRTTVLFDAQLTDQLDDVERELLALLDVLDGSAELRQALVNTRDYTTAQRVGLFEHLCGAQLTEHTRTLVTRALTINGRRPLRAVLRELIDESAARRDELVALVSSVVPLSPVQEARLAAALKRIYGTEVLLNVTVRPEIVGGLHIQVGQDVIDDTVGARLRTARQILGQ